MACTEARHKTFTIGVENENRVGNLLIVCVGPIHIQGPTEWSSCKIRVSKAPESENFLVMDAKANVLILTVMIELKENSKPLNALTFANSQ